MHELKTIVEREFGYVGYCDCCQRANVAFNNSLFCFDVTSLKHFYDTIESGEGLVPFPTSHGKDYMIHTPIDNYFIVMDIEEVEELLAMIGSSFLYLETHHAMKVNVN